jgi:hypothetical protein
VSYLDDAYPLLVGDHYSQACCSLPGTGFGSRSPHEIARIGPGFANNHGLVVRCSLEAGHTTDHRRTGLGLHNWTVHMTAGFDLHSWTAHMTVGPVPHSWIAHKIAGYVLRSWAVHRIAGFAPHETGIENAAAASAASHHHRRLFSEHSQHARRFS